MDDQEIIYKWNPKGIRPFMKLFTYIVRQFLFGLMYSTFSSIESIVQGDFASLMHHKKTIERSLFGDVNEILFFPPFDAHYGDVINLLFFAKSFFEKNKKKLTLISPDHKLAAICKMFDNVNFLYYPTLKNKSIYWIMGPLYLLTFRKIRETKVNFINHTFFLIFEELIGVRTLSMFEKKLGVKLELNNLSIPSVDFKDARRVFDKIASLGFVRNNTVFLNIESRAINMNISINFWGKTIHNIVKRGYSVILNNPIEEFESQQVKYLPLDWDELIPAAEYCGTVISIRNGICDLLQFTHVKLIIIYPILDVDNNIQNKFYFKFTQLYLRELIHNPSNLFELAYFQSSENELSSQIANLVCSPNHT